MGAAVMGALSTGTGAVAMVAGALSTGAVSVVL